MEPSKSSNVDPKKSQFVNEEDFDGNLASQDIKVTRTLGIMSDFNLKAKEKLEIDFFFYTDTSEKAQKLAEQLKKLNFEVAWHEFKMDRKIYSVVGSTDKMQNDEELLIYWSKFMCQLGYKFDCKFDGWGVVSYPE